MINRVDSARVAYPLFHTGEGGSTPTSTLQLRFWPTDVDTAVTLNRLWHSRLPTVRRGNVATGLFYVAEFDGLYYAVAIWTNPVRAAPPAANLARTAAARRRARRPEEHGQPDAGLDGQGRPEPPARGRSPRQLPGQGGSHGDDLPGGRVEPATLDDPRSRPWNHGSRPRNEEQSRAPKQRWQKTITRENPHAPRPT